jgi:hypothetical protein
MTECKPTEEKFTETQRSLGLKKKPPAPSARERKPQPLESALNATREMTFTRKGASRARRAIVYQ